MSWLGQVPDERTSGEAVEQLALLDALVGASMAETCDLVYHVLMSLDIGLGLEHGPIQRALDADQANTRVT